MAVAGLGLSAVALGQVPAYETGTIQPSGPRQGTFGDIYFNIEGANNGIYASYGVARFDVTGLQALFDSQFGIGGWEVCRVDLQLAQSNAGFTTDGGVAVYYTADDTTDAKTLASPLAYPFFDPNTGAADLPVDANDPVVTYTFVETVSGDIDTYTLFLSGDGGQRAALAADIENTGDGTVTLVLVETDPNVAATYAGQSNTNYPPPTLIIRAGPAGGSCPPVADAGPDQQVTDDDFDHVASVTLDGSASFDTDGTIVRYLWTEDPNTVLADSNSPTAVVNLGLGTHVITLTVEDNSGLSDTDQVVVEVIPGGKPPFADAGAPVEVTETTPGVPETVTLDASGSFDTDGTIISYDWYERGTPIATGEITAADFDVGMHTVILVIEDNAGWVVRDVKFIKVLPASTFARHNFDAVNDATVTQDPPAGTFTSPGDSFEIKQRGISASIPWAATDDTGSADPNGAESCDSGVFPFDSIGIVMCAERDAFFCVVDIRNADNPNCDSGTASFTFDITGQSNIWVSIDMGASGNFEAIDPNEANIVCDPNDFLTTPGDAYDWTWSVDGSPPQPLFTSSVDEAGSQTYEYFSGFTAVIDDPLLMNGTVLDNLMKTIAAPIPATGNSLTITLNARGDSGSEAYVFDEIVLYTEAAEPNVPCGPDCGGADIDLDCDVDLDDLVILLQNFGKGPVPPAQHSEGDADNDQDVDLDDLVILLQNFGSLCP